MWNEGGAVLLNIIKEAKSRFVDKIKADELFKTTIQGKILGKPSRGRRRLNMLGNV